MLLICEALLCFELATSLLPVGTACANLTCKQPAFDLLMTGIIMGYEHVMYEKIPQSSELAT